VACTSSPFRSYQSPVFSLFSYLERDLEEGGHLLNEYNFQGDLFDFLLVKLALINESHVGSAERLLKILHLFEGVVSDQVLVDTHRQEDTQPEFLSLFLG